MHRRKIQLIAGTTYSVSLPKEWIKENSLKEKDELVLHERNDRTLLVSPKLIKKQARDEIHINIDDHQGSVDQLMFALYYIGFENITLFSKEEFSKEVRSQIRKTLTHMSGTEISHEDSKSITVHVMLDISKVNLHQILYRIRLIIDSSMDNMSGKMNISEIRINENEIDRLYHLTSKILSLSLIDSNVLHSSGLRNISHLPAHFLIAKKLENLADNVKHMAEYMNKLGLTIDDRKETLDTIRAELARSIEHLLGRKGSFERMPDSVYKVLNDSVDSVSDTRVKSYLESMVRNLTDIQQEIVYISFYSRMIEDGVI